MNVLSLTSSRFFGGPERQMLGLATAAGQRYRTAFASFAENELCRDFLDRARQLGFPATQLKYDTPHLYGALRELRALLRQSGTDVLVCHGYKAGLLGWLAARQVGIPVIAVSRGWTAQCHRVRLYEWIDRRVLRRIDRVVCVSQAQAGKVVAAGVCPGNVEVIHNAISSDRFQQPDPQYRKRLVDVFPESARGRIKVVVGSAGRLSPEKGFDVLIDAAGEIIRLRGDVGFVLFGDGQLKDSLSDQVRRLGMADRVVLAGFCDKLDRFMPHLDLFVQSSHTEGLPNVLLEALAAGVPVVATDVGGTAELLDQGRYGTLVRSGDSRQLAMAVARLLSQPDGLAQQVAAGREWVVEHFTFDRQADAYLKLFCGLNGHVHA